MTLSPLVIAIFVILCFCCAHVRCVFHNGYIIYVITWQRAILYPTNQVHSCSNIILTISQVQGEFSNGNKWQLKFFKIVGKANY